jgi:hypothetical protein
MSHAGLRFVLTIVGGVAAVFGALGVVKGADGVHDGGNVSPNVDSELRFFASWYAVFGLLVLRAARQPAPEATIVRACGAGFLLAACSRLLSMRAAGPPSTVFKVLTGIELAVPAVIVPWQHRVERESSADRAPGTRAVALL